MAKVIPWNKRTNIDKNFDLWDDEDNVFTTVSPSGRRSLSDFWRPKYTEELIHSDGSENVREWAKHLSSLRETARIIFGRGLTVNWATADMSFTDVTKGDIRISPRFLKLNDPEHTDWTVGERLDAAHGASMHEGAHNKWTPAYAMEECMKRGGQTLAEIFNIVEDGYIEAEVMHDWPGFSGYIDALWNFYLTNAEIPKRIHAFEDQNMTLVNNPTTEDEFKMIAEQFGAFLNAFIALVKSRNTVDLSTVALKSDRHSEMVQVMERLADKLHSVEETGLPLDDRLDTAQLVHREFARLFPKRETHKTGEEPVFALDGTAFADLIGKIMRESGVGNASGRTNVVMPGTVDPNGNPVATEVVSAEGAANIQGVMDAELREMMSEQFHTSGNSGEQIKVHVFNMRRTRNGDARYKETKAEVRFLEGRLKKAIKFRSTDRQYMERGRPHGKLDQTRMYELPSFGSKDIFYRKITTTAPRAHIGVLVDESGSMGSPAGGRRTKEACARQGAIMLEGVLSQEQTVTYEFWGHTGDMHGSTSYANATNKSSSVDPDNPLPAVSFPGPVVMKYLDSRNGMTDPRVLGRITARANNYDGHALDVVTRNMIESAPDERKILFIICDGMPAGSAYGDGVGHTAHEVRKARKKGVQVICIFVGQLGRAKEQMISMYGREGDGWFQTPNAEDLPIQMQKISGRLLAWDGN